MSKYFFAILLASFSFSLASISAPAGAAEEKPAAKKTSKQKTKASKEDEAPAGSVATEFTCAQGKKVTIYRNPSDEQHQTMRWNKKLYKMTRVETESGAVRLENTTDGLTWISVPAKAMLLDAKKGQTIVNDCKK